MMLGLDMAKGLVSKEPRFAASALFFLMLSGLFGLAMMLETRTILDANLWVKPLKFSLSLALYLATLALYARWLPQQILQRKWFQPYSYVIIFCALAEILWIGGAAMMGVRSHFNGSEPFLVAVYPVMGLVAVTLTSASLIYGWQILRDQTSSLTRPLRWSLALGLILTFVLTVPLASYLSSQGGHIVGGELTKAGGLTLFGWSVVSGDLRVAHFFATHALHFIPVLGLVSLKISSVKAGMIWVFGVSAFYAALVVGAFLQALAGQPLL